MLLHLVTAFRRLSAHACQLLDVVIFICGSARVVLSHTLDNGDIKINVSRLSREIELRRESGRSPRAGKWFSTKRTSSRTVGDTVTVEGFKQFCFGTQWIATKPDSGTSRT